MALAPAFFRTANLFTVDFYLEPPPHEQTSHEWKPIEGLVFNGDHEATHDIVEGRQGRSLSSIGHGRSVIEPHTAPHRYLKSKFVTQLAQFLADALQQKRYYRLIIAAPPVTLGDLRSAISPQVQETIIAEFAHDLTKIPNHEIGSHLMPVPVA
jgi:protein required for attachment to host cells